jgi:hypothetical protein
MSVLSHATRSEELPESSTDGPDAAEASVTIDGARHAFAVLKGTLGPNVIDIGALYQDTGRFFPFLAEWIENGACSFLLCGVAPPLRPEINGGRCTFCHTA